MDDHSSVSVIDLERLEAIEEDFSDATQLGIITVDCRGVPVTPACGFSAFCLEIRKDPIRRMRCYSCDAHGGLEAAIEGRPSIYRCHTGLVDFSVPIIVGDQYVGAILCGQIRVDGPPEDGRYLIGRDESWRRDSWLRDLYDEIPSSNSRKIEAAANMLATLGESLARKATSRVTVPLSTDGPPPGWGPTPPAVLPIPPAVLPIPTTRTVQLPLVEPIDQVGVPVTSVTSISLLTSLPTEPVTAPGLTLTSAARDLLALEESVEDEDFPSAVQALNQYLDSLFASSGRYISKDRLMPIEDELIRLAAGISQVTGNDVAQTVRRYRAKQASHPNRYICQTYLESLLSMIVSGLIRTNPSRKRTMASLMNHLECNPTRAWTLKDAATYLGMSVSHTSKRFKAYTGRTFVEYICEKRIERAKLMLVNTDMPVAKIAKEVNFLPNYFSRVFKASTGLSPSAYREAHADPSH